ATRANKQPFFAIAHCFAPTTGLERALSLPFVEYPIAGRVRGNMRKTQMPVTALETGQVWQVDDSSVHIGIVGKRLVHYKMFKGQTKRAPISLSGKDVLQ